MITIPTSTGHDEGKRFNFSLSPFDSDGPQGSVECVQQKINKDVLQSLGRIEYKLKIQATDESFGATKAKMAAASTEAAKKATKVINAGKMGRKFIPQTKVISRLNGQLKSLNNHNSHHKSILNKPNHSSQVIKPKFDVSKIRPIIPSPKTLINPLKRKSDVNGDATSKVSKSGSASPENSQAVPSLSSSSSLSVPKLRQTPPESLVSNVSRGSNLRSSSNDPSSHDSSQTNASSNYSSHFRNKPEIKATSVNDSKSSSANMPLNDSNGDFKCSPRLPEHLVRQHKSSYSSSSTSGATNYTNGHSVPAIKLNGHFVPVSASTTTDSPSSSRPVSPAVTREEYDKLKTEFDNLHKKYLHLTNVIEPVTLKFNRLEAMLNTCNEGSSEWNVRHYSYPTSIKVIHYLDSLSEGDRAVLDLSFPFCSPLIVLVLTYNLLSLLLYQRIMESILAEYDRMKKDAKFNQDKSEREYLHKKLLPMRKELLRMKRELNIKDSPDARPSSSLGNGSLRQTSPGCSSDSNDENHSFQDNRHKRLKVDDHRSFDDNNNDGRRNGHTLANGINSTLLAV